MRQLFFYGTLCHLPLLKAVLGHEDFDARPAALKGYRVHHAGTKDYPAIRRDDQSVAQGVLFLNPTPEDVVRLDFYERDPEFDYYRAEVEVEQAGRVQQADIYLPEDPREDGGDWNVESWASRWGDMTVRAAAEMMELFGTDREATAARQFPIMKLRAASYLRARTSATPASLRSPIGHDAVRVAQERRPYSNYFAMAEIDISYPQFTGGQGQTVTRAALASGDAATVLPYDPARDRVLLIEQFRFGVYVRGDNRPWLLEPPAGRIDPGETPQEAAARELQEEAGVAASELIQIASYYPSPAAMSEYIYSFIALCELPELGTGTGGLEAEQEDIRTHVISFDRAMELVATGEADCAPLLLSLLWLEKHRGQLRRSG